MKATRFSGPTLYSDQYPPLEGLPTSFNPDYYQFMDDFEGKIVDTTNYWTFDSINNGTLSVYDASGTSPAPYDNASHGVCEIRSEAVDPSGPLTLNSGGTMYSYINFQPFVRGQSVFYESRVGVTNPKNCDFFTGIIPSNAIANPFNPVANTFRTGFRLVESDGTGKIECVSVGAQAESKVTDFDMPSAVPIYLSSTAGENGNAGPVDRFGIANLGLHISHMTPRGKEGSDYQIIIKYFINRKLVHTTVADKANPVFTNNAYSIITSYKKVSNRAGVTLQTDLPNTTADVYAYIDIPGTEDNNGSGLSTGTFLKVGNEYLRVLVLSPSNKVGSRHYALVARAQLGTAADTHTAGTTITEDTGSCLTDYSALSTNRYPVYQDVPNVNSQYLVDGFKTR